MPQVLEAEPLRRLRIAPHLKAQLEAAAAVHGGDLHAALGSLGDALGQQLQVVLAAAG